MNNAKEDETRESRGQGRNYSRIIKSRHEYNREMACQIIQNILGTRERPKPWKQGLIVKIPKKGDLTECGNWRGITLTSVPSKVFLRLLIDRIRYGVNCKLIDEQAGFRSERGTVEQIFSLRNIIQQVVEWQATLYITFVGF